MVLRLLHKIHLGREERVLETLLPHVKVERSVTGLGLVLEAKSRVELELGARADFLWDS